MEFLFFLLLNLFQVVESANPFRCRHAVESTGGWWGATTVDDELEKFIMVLFGPKLFEAYMAAAVPRLSMLSAWESYKKTFKSVTSTPFDCRLEFLEDQEVDLKNVVGTFSDHSFGPVADLAARTYVIKIPVSFVKSFFRVPLEKIVKHLLVQTARVVEAKQPFVEFILLAGGFSESPYLQEVIGDAFASQVIISHNAGSLIQTGAVMYGLTPETITSRIMRCTFGYRVAEKFATFRFLNGTISIADKNTFDHKETGDKYITRFIKFVEKGETVSFSDEISHSISPLYDSQRECTIDIYYTAKTTVPIFVDEPLVKKIGTFVVDMGVHGENKSPSRHAFLTFRFGLTSLEVTAVAALTGEEFIIELVLPK